MVEDRFLVLQASAGSGKTFALIYRYLKLLFMGANPSRILAITFTRKATSEMYERIVKALRNPESGEAKMVRESLNLSEDDYSIRSKEILYQFLQSELKIQTIDSFQNSILKSFSNYAGLMPNFRVGTGIDIEQFQNYFDSRLTVAQRGSIKTLTLLHSGLKFYPDDGYGSSIWQILEGMYEREIEIKEFVSGEPLPEISLSQIGLIEEEIVKLATKLANEIKECEKLSKTAVKALTFSSIDELLSAGKTWLQKEQLEEYPSFKKAKPTDQQNRQLSEIKELIERLLFAKNSLFIGELLELFYFYVAIREDFIKRENRLSYSDVNHFLIKLLVEQRVDTDYIYFRLDSQIDHFLIDEFQDTSLVQYRILEPLFRDLLSGGSNLDKSFFYVGDTKQAIYRFRGGFSRLFNYVEKSYSIPKKILTENYRSRKVIVDFLNRTFKDSYEDYTPQQIGNIEAQSGGHLLVETLPQDEVFNRAVESVKELLNRGVPPHQIAILTNKNSDSGELSQMLVEESIEVQIDSSIGLLEHRDVDAVVNYLKYLHSGEKFYLYNSLSLSGEDPFNPSIEPDLDDYREDRLFETAIKVVEKLKLYREDRNLNLFLQIVGRFKDLTEFIHNIDDIEDSVVKGSGKGVNILTIHKSKGLEFNYVILLDSKQPIIRNPIIYSYSTDSELQLQGINWQFKNSDFDSHYREAKEVELEAVSSDTLNRYYVGFSRAIDSLHIIKLQDKSAIDGLLDVPNQSIGEISESYEAVKKESKVDFCRDLQFSRLSQSVEKKDSENGEVEDSSYTVFESVMVSSIGSMFHSAMEMFSEFKSSEIEPIIHSIRGRNRGRLSEKDLLGIEKRIRGVIENSDFREMVDGSTEIKREQSYRLTDGSRVIMDLLLFSKDSVTVIDYKSFRNINRIEQYREQLENYKRVLSKVYRDKRVFGFLLYSTENSVQLKTI
jgi:exodeoxyribonuclease V beta subunit